AEPRISAGIAGDRRCVGRCLAPGTDRRTAEELARQVWIGAPDTIGPAALESVVGMQLAGALELPTADFVNPGRLGIGAPADDDQPRQNKKCCPHGWSTSEAIGQSAQSL